MKYAICSNIERLRYYHTKWSKADKEKYQMISLICRILKNDTSELIHETNRLKVLENKFIVTKRDIGLPHGSHGKGSAYNAGDPGSIPGSGRSPGERNGNPLQYSCLENSTDRGAWSMKWQRVGQDWATWLSLSKGILGCGEREIRSLGLVCTHYYI